MPIEPITSIHEPKFRQWMKDDVSSRKFISRSVPSFTGIDKLFHQILDLTEGSDFLAWIQRTDTDEILAYAELKQSAKVNGTELELIYVVSESWRGKGVATKLVRDILDQGVWDKSRKVVAYVSASNINSHKVLLNNQFGETTNRYDGVRYELTRYA